VKTPSLYRGRFAPSPSGPLHMGSLLAATASYLDAKSNHGKWLVRIEDIDPPREQAGASDLILQSLHDHGLVWDDDVLFQSTRHDAYDQALSNLLERRQLFYCTCTRASLAQHDGYPGNCRQQIHPPREPAALRLTCDQCEFDFTDMIQGPQHWQVSPKDDMILKRKDGLYAYQLAVVVDDEAQGITHVVRGIDLLDSTVKQLYLYQQLGIKPPTFSHIPVVLDDNGNKLSKQNHATAIEKQHAPQNILQCLTWLKQPIPPKHTHGSCHEILTYAIEHWNIDPLKGQVSV